MDAAKFMAVLEREAVRGGDADQLHDAGCDGDGEAAGCEVGDRFGHRWQASLRVDQVVDDGFEQHFLAAFVVYVKAARIWHVAAFGERSVEPVTVAVDSTALVLGLV